MRVLFDQATPVPILPSLKGHTVRTASQEGWDTLSNGELIDAAEAAGFEVAVTTDKNVRYEQNLAGRSRIVVEAVSAAEAGTHVEVDIPG